MTQTNQISITEENKYSTKDITKWIRQELKNVFGKDLKFSVRFEGYAGGSSINLTLLESKKVRFIKTFEEVTEEDILHIMCARNYSEEESKTRIKSILESKHFDINQYHFESDFSLTDEGKKIVGQILKIANKHNWDRSDAQSDYFDVNYYLSLSLGSYDKPFIDGNEESRYILIENSEVQQND